MNFNTFQCSLTCLNFIFVTFFTPFFVLLIFPILRYTEIQTRRAPMWERIHEVGVSKSTQFSLRSSLSFVWNLIKKKKISSLGNWPMMKEIWVECGVLKKRNKKPVPLDHDLQLLFFFTFFFIHFPMLELLSSFVNHLAVLSLLNVNTK